LSAYATEMGRSSVLAYAAMKTFKFKFVPNLKLALAVYPAAKVEDDGERGLILHPSPAPVTNKQSIGNR
jgi:hypothetical protein